ncbi:hypothetical protein, partial [Brachyspira murdochii]|uniref:hypothetical protein n=1 Tax=Brachyspira murdochii TaxID=84378 RepID=UPI0015E3E758
VLTSRHLSLAKQFNITERFIKTASEAENIDLKVDFTSINKILKVEKKAFNRMVKKCFGIGKDNKRR